MRVGLLVACGVCFVLGAWTYSRARDVPLVQAAQQRGWRGEVHARFAVEAPQLDEGDDTIVCRGPPDVSVARPGDAAQPLPLDAREPEPDPAALSVPPRHPLEHPDIHDAIVVQRLCYVDPAERLRSELMGARRDDRPTRNAILAGIDWLCAHQETAGGWAAADRGLDPAVTALALLSLMETGQTHEAGTRREHVASGLRFLRSLQGTDGWIGSRTATGSPFNHAAATLALVRAYDLTGSRLLRDAAQQAIHMVQAGQNPYLGWRNGVRDGENATSATGWMTIALKAAKRTALEVDGGAFRGARAWVEQVTDPATGRTGDLRPGEAADFVDCRSSPFPAQHVESLAATAVLIRLFMGADSGTDAALAKGIDIVASRPPRVDDLDAAFSYLGTLAMAQVGGERRREWKRALRMVLHDLQRDDADAGARGSWDPSDAWAQQCGGRAYATSMACLALRLTLLWQ